MVFHLIFLKAVWCTYHVAFMAGLPNRPNVYTPTLKICKERQNRTFECPFWLSKSLALQFFFPVDIFIHFFSSQKFVQECHIIPQLKIYNGSLFSDVMLYLLQNSVCELTETMSRIGPGKR